MSDQNRDALIQQFIHVTGAAPDFASSFLEAADWNVNLALDMYLGGGGEQAAEMTGSTRAQQQTGSLESSSDARLMARVRALVEEQGIDEATALAIAEAEGGDADDVRAPIAPTTARLIEQENPRFPELEGELARMRNRLFQSGLSASMHPNNMDLAFQTGRNGAPMEQDDEIDNDRFEPPSLLRNILGPPREILFQGSWEQARSFGKESNRWILVNIQTQNEFLSFILNRDLWCTEIVKDLIQNNFVFFQHDKTSPEGQQFVTFYQPTSLPHVAIVDPFTGEEMKIFDLSRFQADSSDLLSNFLEQINNFMEKNQLEGERIKLMQEKLRKRQQEKDAKILKRKQERGVTVDAVPLVHAEELVQAEELARPAMIEEGDNNNNTHQHQDDDVRVLEEWENLEDEPTESNETTKVQLRLFGPTKVIRRRFRKSQLIKDLFNFVRQKVPESRKRPFDLISFPSKSLKDVQDQTLEEQNLNNCSLTAVYL